MPDVDQPPIDTLPCEELRAKLRALTNLKVAEDQAVPSGYRVGGGLPGLEDVPTW
jgi:hypothetical protein